MDQLLGHSVTYRIAVGRQQGARCLPRRRCRASMGWARRLNRVFNIDIETCATCGSTAKLIARIEDPVVIEKILDHLSSKVPIRTSVAEPENRLTPPPRFDIGYCLP